MAKEHAVRLLWLPYFLVASLLRQRLAVEYDVFDILLCHVRGVRDDQSAAHGSRTSDLPWDVVKVLQKGRLSLSTAAHLLLANPWPSSGSHSKGDGGSTECKFLVDSLRCHSQPAAELVPILARGRTMPGCREEPSTGECWGQRHEELTLMNMPHVGVFSKT